MHLWLITGKKKNYFTQNVKCAVCSFKGFSFNPRSLSPWIFKWFIWNCVQDGEEGQISIQWKQPTYSYLSSTTFVYHFEASVKKFKSNTKKELLFAKFSPPSPHYICLTLPGMDILPKYFHFFSTSITCIICIEEISLRYLTWCGGSKNEFSRL